jgi:transcriptional regulator with XRE-family HTH domain
MAGIRIVYNERDQMGAVLHSGVSLDKLARDRIRQWMRMTGVSQDQLAGRLNKTQPWVSRYLGGETDADLETLQRMAALFGHGLHALLDLPQNPDEQFILERYRALPEQSRAVVRQLLEVWSPAEGRTKSR